MSTGSLAIHHLDISRESISVSFSPFSPPFDRNTFETEWALVVSSLLVIFVNQKPLIDKRAFFFLFLFFLFLIDVSEKCGAISNREFLSRYYKMQRYPGYRRFDGNNRTLPDHHRPPIRPSIVFEKSRETFRSNGESYPDPLVKLVISSGKFPKGRVGEGKGIYLRAL